jgi:hypothetical protein
MPNWVFSILFKRKLKSLIIRKIPLYAGRFYIEQKRKMLECSKIGQDRGEKVDKN